MNQFFTSIDIPVSSKKIGYENKILLLGSCFADNIGAKFGEYYFQTTINPLGTLYNPFSIAHAISLSQKADNMELPLVEYGGLWHSMMHHGEFSHPNKTLVEQHCAKSIQQLSEAINRSSVVIITFGTAWVYEYEGRVVANCHKLPADRFVRRRLTIDEIVAIWQPIIASMPDKHWIFTVSPIRHIKDGLHENQISKTILLQAIDHLTSNSVIGLTSNSEAVSYFPSYEIMLDELRDYRFYAEDMVHPSATAVEYIWQRFVATYMMKDTQAEMRTLHQLWRDRHHRFLHPESEEARAFQERTNQRLHELQERYPWLK